MTKSVTKIQDKDTTRRLSVVRSTEDPTKYGIVILNPDGSRIRGPKGEAATVNVGTTTTSNPGTSASVENVGTESDAILDFTIPRGSIVSAGTTSTGNPGSSANVTENVVDGDVILNFTIPRGSVVSVGSTTTGGAGTSASVVNTGTGGDVVLDFTIPRGDRGDTGNGISSVTSSKSGKITTVTINFTDGSTPFTFQVSDGEGDVNGPISAVDGDVVLFDGASGKTIKDSGIKLSDKQDKLTAGENIGLNNNVISADNVFIIKESDVTVSTDATKGVSPYNTSYGYTNIVINDTGIKWVEGAIYTFVINTTMVVQSAYRNVRVKIGNGSYIPVMGTSSIIAGSSYFTKTNIRQYQYSTKYQSGGALHLFTDSNTTYSAMTTTEIDAGTGTTARNITPANLKYAIQKWDGNVISDVAYGSGWNGDTTHAPSKNAVYDKIKGIDDVIPSAATSSNQLADKNYVDDSINSVTAYYITKNAQGAQFATYSELANATTFYSGGVVRVPTRNDYTIVLDDENHSHATTRYIYNSGWEYQYTVNETALTQAQLDALNSGITSGKVSTYDGYASGKQDALTLPATPTSGHLVTWGANNKTLVDGGVVPTVPTNVSSFNNDAGYLTSSTGVTSVNGSNGAVNVNDIKASSSAPSNPTEGMVWYDTTNDVVKVYDGSSWNEVGGGGGATYNAGPGIEIGTYNDYSAMRGPCDEGFHIPTSTEMQALINAGISLSAWTSSNGDGMKTYLKLPYSGWRSYSNGNQANSGYNGHYYCCDRTTSPKALYVSSSQAVLNSGGYRSEGDAIRPFKDTPIVPDSSWNTLYAGTGDAGIFHNAILGLISISSDGITWITISDKNVGATVVYNSGDTLDGTNCGGYFQRGNCYMFPYTGTITTSSTNPSAEGYGPGNYYSSDTFILGYSWDTSNNKNLRGGVTGVVTINNAITNIGVLSVNGKGGDVLVQAQHSSLTATLTSAGWSSSEQTVSVSGVTASNTVIVSPSPSSMSEYTNAKVFCSAQGSNSLTFSCTDTPTSDIVVNVLILN